MDFLFSSEWGKVLALDLSLLETFVRGAVAYLILFLVLRFAVIREPVAMGITDLLAIVLIADAAQGGLRGDSHPAFDGILIRRHCNPLGPCVR